MARAFDRERKKLAPINRRRGLFRLWILVSGVWIMGWLIYFVIQLMADNWSGRDLLTVPVVLLSLWALRRNWNFNES
jgi:hypothetical protein